MPLRRRLALLAAAFVVSFAVLALTADVVDKSRSRAANQQLQLTESSQLTLRLVAAYGDMDTELRRFIVGGTDDFLEPYRSREAAVNALQSTLASKTSSLDRSIRSGFKDVMTHGLVWKKRTARALQTRQTEGRAAAERMISERVSERAFDTLRGSLRTLNSRLASAERSQRHLRETRAHQMGTLILVMPIVALLYLILVAVLANRWVVRPLRAMARAVRQVTGGDLTVVVPRAGATDVAELGASIDDMRNTIIERLAESDRSREIAVRAREAIEQNAILALQLRTELASEFGELPQGWTASAELLPAEGWVAGDCYDVSLVAPHVLAVLVIDIAGHGAAQAVQALKCKEILRAALRMGVAPGAALGLLAEQVGEMYPSFLTAVVALIETTTGQCRYANAGHPPPLLAHDDQVLLELEPTGPLLGPFAGEWRTETATIGPGGKLLLYTDGLTEARDVSGTFYGMERLASIVVTLPCEEAASVIKACLADLHDFTPARLIDDVTMVLLCRACAD